MDKDKLSKHERDRLRKAVKPRNWITAENLFNSGAGKHGKTIAQTRSNDRAKLRREWQSSGDEA